MNTNSLEEELREGVARYHALAEVLPLIVWEGRHDGYITYCNPQWFAYSGLSMAESEGDGWTRAIHPEHRDRVYRLWREAATRDGHYEVEIPFLRAADNAYRWHLARGVSVRDATGRIVKWVGVALDVHDRYEARQAQEALADQRALTQTVAENTASGLFFMDENGRPVYMNPAAESLTGYKIEEISHRPLHYAVHHTHPDGTPYPIEECPIDRSNESLVPIQGHEDVFVRKDGTFFPVVCACTPLQKEGRRIGAVIEFRDITSVKEAEEVRARHLAEIEALNVRLRRAMQETHHRVKNNLQIVSALSEVQADGGAPVPASALARIGQHARALAMIHDLLTQGAQETGTADDVSVRSVLDRLIPLLLATAGGRAVRCASAEFRLPVRQGASLTMLISELVSNSIKHGAGEVEVTLALGEAWEAGRERRRERRARLEVCDDGPGFPPGFDPKKAANTGLDLIESAARHDLQGEITFENRTQGGARVVLVFPLPAEEPKAE